MAQGKSWSFATLVHICYKTTLRVQKDLGMILEVDLNYLVTKAKHDCVLSAHPLLHIDMSATTLGGCSTDITTRSNSARWSPWFGERLRPCSFLMILQVWAEVLHKSNFLMQFFWIIADIMSLHNVLLLSGWHSLSFIIVESGVTRLRVKKDFGWVIEENTCRSIWEKIAKTVLWGIINPFLYPTLGCRVVLNPLTASSRMLLRHSAWHIETRSTIGGKDLLVAGWVGLLGIFSKLESPLWLKNSTAHLLLRINRSIYAPCSICKYCLSSRSILLRILLLLRWWGGSHLVAASSSRDLLLVPSPNGIRWGCTLEPL